MRRKDREVTDQSEIVRILDTAKVIRLAINTGEAPYIVPVNFGYECLPDHKFNFFIHGAQQGTKMSPLQENPQVGVEMDIDHHLIEAEQACQYSFGYASIIGKGTAEFLKTPEDKIRGISLIMKHETGQNHFRFEAQHVQHIAVVKIMIHTLTAKKH